MKTIELLDDEVTRVVTRLQDAAQEVHKAGMKGKPLPASKLPWLLETVERSQRVLCELRGMMVAYRACALKAIPLTAEPDTPILTEWREAARSLAEDVPSPS